MDESDGVAVMAQIISFLTAGLGVGASVVIGNENVVLPTWALVISTMVLLLLLFSTTSLIYYIGRNAFDSDPMEVYDGISWMTVPGLSTALLSLLLAILGIMILIELALFSLTGISL